MRSDKATFPGAHGALLAARLDAPDGPPRACALFAHCFTCSKDIFAAGRIAPLVHRVYPLEQAAEAHRAMEAGEHFGKIVLRVAQ